MHDQSCQVPSAAGQMEKSTGCCPGDPSIPRSGSPAICQKGPSIVGIRTTLAAPPAPPVPVVAPLELLVAPPEPLVDDAPPPPHAVIASKASPRPTRESIAPSIPHEASHAD